MTWTKTQFRLVLMHLWWCNKGPSKNAHFFKLKQWQVTMNVRTVYYCHCFSSTIRKENTLVFVDNPYAYMAIKNLSSTDAAYSGILPTL